MPQAASAHDTFWDFVSLMPESTHMLMWVMSDRALPRSYRMMQGFGVHTFRLVNDQGKSTFVKFHWRPLAGTHSLDWDEAVKLGPRPGRRDVPRNRFPEERALAKSTLVELSGVAVGRRIVLIAMCCRAYDRDCSGALSRAGESSPTMGRRRRRSSSMSSSSVRRSVSSTMRWSST